MKIKPEILELLATSPHPINLSHFFKRKQLDQAIELISSLIRENELFGAVTRTYQYLPARYLQQEVTTELETVGQVDLLEWLQRHQPLDPQGFLELLIAMIEQSGFAVTWDLQHRKCYLPIGAINELRLMLNRFKSRRMIRWDHLMRSLKWPEELIEASLDMLADQQQFVGVLDGNILYDLRDIRESLLQGNNEAMQIFKHIITRINEEYRRIPISWIKELFQVEMEDIEVLIGKAWSESLIPPYLFTEDGKNLRSVLIILQEAITVLFAYRTMPKHFLQDKLALKPDDLERLLSVTTRLIPSIKIVADEILCPPPIDVIMEGFSLSITEMVNATRSDLLTILVPLIKARGFLPYVANEQLIKGIKSFAIYCQLCNNSYENPTMFYECMNCTRQTCATCYEQQPQRSCAYCENIADFILDLPRYCQHCDLFYFTSTAFVDDTESCIFCDSQLTHVRQSVYEVESFRPTKGLISRLIDVITEKSVHTATVPLRELIDSMTLEDETVVYLLENAMALGLIDGYIDPYEATVNISTDEVGIKCIQCDKSVEENKGIQCQDNHHVFCHECHEELVLVGFDACPECNSPFSTS